MNQLSEAAIWKILQWGQTFGSGGCASTGDGPRVRCEFDPQPFHSMKRRRAARFRWADREGWQTLR